MKNFTKLISLKRFFAALLLLAVATGCQVNYVDPPPPPPPPAPNPCGYGYSGLNGNAFVALDYAIVEPTYIWGNNPAFPGYFEYGAYYVSSPGFFKLYYEGAFMDGCCLTEYYWDVDYTLWIHPGEPGGPCGQNGANGPDSFLGIWMDPYGPDFDRINKTSNIGIEILTDTETVKEVKYTLGAYELTAKYTKLDKSRKAELDAEGVLKGKGS